MIRQIGKDKWRLYSLDGSRNLGTFNSLEAAKKHEREVEYFKHRKDEVKLAEVLYEQEEDYRGQHRAPDENDSPIWDVTLKGTYPEDFYSANGARYYGDGSPGDFSVVSLIQSLRNKPKAKVKIYRAVPKLGLQDQIDELDAQKKYILKTGKLPPHANTPLNPNEYYEFLSDQIQKMQHRIDSGEEEPAAINSINSGDWVTIYKPYAVQHGKSNLRSLYKILSKTVLASQLFTDGNSVYEWGYVA